MTEQKDILGKNNQNDWVYRTNRLIIEKHLFKPKQRILIAISGGQDSMLLLSLMFRLQSHWFWFLSAIYCNHKWYNDQIHQSKHIFRLCHTMHIPFFLGIPIWKVQTEEKARKWRYSLMTTIALTHKYNHITTGHSASDRIETLLYNTFRGTSLQGLQALNWQRKLNGKLAIQISKNINNSILQYSVYVYAHWFEPLQIKRTQNLNLQLVRPLLNSTRKEIEDNIRISQIPILADPSNRRINIRRNRIRHQLLPFLRKYFNPKVDLALSHLSDILHDDVMYIDKITNTVCAKHINSQTKQTIYKNIYHIKINNQVLKVLPIGIQRRILKKILEFCKVKQFKFVHLEQVRLWILKNQSIVDNQRPIKVLNTNSNKIACIQLPNNVQVCLSSKDMCWFITT